jgi:hypothetical protein
MSESTIGKGVRFAALHVDDVVTFEVKRRQGRGAWRAVVVDNEDFAGTERVFTTEEIEAALRRAAMAKESARAQGAWFDGLQLGATIHYNNGFGAYVRTTVVAVEGKNMLRPLALVGRWQTGSADYFIAKIRSREAWRPHHTLCFESGNAHARCGDFDPTTAAAIPLDTLEQRRRW